MSKRNALLATVHIAKKELDMDDVTYRDVLQARDGLIQVGLVQGAVGQPGADVGLLLLQRVDEPGQGVQLALVLVAQLLFL